MLRLEHALRRALRDGELSLAYQPIVALGSGTPVAVEALLRWNDPERGAVPPAEFVPLAEEIGLIEEIGRWVLETAAAQVARWQAAAPDLPLGVTVNVSGQQIASRSFVDDVRRVLRSSGLAPGSLAVEITESVLLRETSAPHVLGDLRTLGVEVLLDDFGIGYSALGYLRKLPIDGIKIDRAFVADLLTGEQGEAIVGAVVTMAHALGLRVVAEGVETQRQATLLAGLGCEHAQGFLFARPEAAADAAQALGRG
jgi:EAL domain-containing protein (putative c-di-GMP-specific phosphodiesterase class I)